MDNKPDGVYLNERTRNEKLVQVWVAESIIKGKRLRKYFSVDKYGYQEAYELACKTRLDFEMQIAEIDNILDSEDNIYILLYKENLSLNYLKELEVKIKSDFKVVFLKNTIFLYNLKEEKWKNFNIVNDLNEYIYKE